LRDVLPRGLQKPLVAGSSPAAATYYFPGEFPTTDFEYAVHCVTIRNNIVTEGSKMKVARIVGPFSLSAVLFILSYVSLKDIGSGFYSILLMVIGVVLVVVGIAAIFSDK
jgi:amino acid transporter